MSSQRALIYMDYAAATPLSDAALAAMQPYFQEQFYNPSAGYLAARSVALAVATARKQIAGVLGVLPHEIFFTAGGTEANNLAVRGVMEQHPGCHAVASAVEHESVLAPLELYDHTLVPVRPDASVDPSAVAAAITDTTVLVSVMLANNEVGTIQPLHDIAAAVEAVRSARRAAGNSLPLYLHTDACQAPLYLDIHAARLGADLMTLNGGKMYGPKQSGLLMARSHVMLSPQVRGGGQERGMRSGTENVPAIMGLAAALTSAQENARTESRRLSCVQQQFMSRLADRLPDCTINGSRKNRLANNIHVTFPGQDNERLMMELDERGILCAVGSACSASSEAPSHVLLAMGLTEAAARASLRFSLGKSSTTEEVEAVITALAEIIADSSKHTPA